MYEIIFNKEIETFLTDLREHSSSNKNYRIQYKQILQHLKYLSETGTRIGEPTIKRINADLWELRPGKNRIFFFYWRDNKFVLVHQFVKKSTKTPLREIEQAKSNMTIFLNDRD